MYMYTHTCGCSCSAELACAPKMRPRATQTHDACCQRSVFVGALLWLQLLAQSPPTPVHRPNQPPSIVHRPLFQHISTKETRRHCQCLQVLKHLLLLRQSFRVRRIACPPCTAQQCPAHRRVVDVLIVGTCGAGGRFIVAGDAAAIVDDAPQKETSNTSPKANKNLQNTIENQNKKIIVEDIKSPLPPEVPSAVVPLPLPGQVPLPGQLPTPGSGLSKVEPVVPLPVAPLPVAPVSDVKLPLPSEPATQQAAATSPAPPSAIAAVFLCMLSAMTAIANGRRKMSKRHPQYQTRRAQVQQWNRAGAPTLPVDGNAGPREPMLCILAKLNAEARQWNEAVVRILVSQLPPRWRERFPSVMLTGEPGDIRNHLSAQRGYCQGRIECAQAVVLPIWDLLDWYYAAERAQSSSASMPPLPSWFVEWAAYLGMTVDELVDKLTRCYFSKFKECATQYQRGYYAGAVMPLHVVTIATDPARRGVHCIPNGDRSHGKPYFESSRLIMTPSQKSRGEGKEDQAQS